MTRSETHAPAKAYAIQAREEATAPHVIASTFSLFNVTIHALINPRLTHSYIYTALVTKRNMLVKLTEFDVRVTNSLDQCVIINKICKDCSLRIWGYGFQLI